MGARDPSELSLQSLLIASVAWMVVLTWSTFLNTWIDGIAERMNAQNGPEELWMRFGVAVGFTAVALLLARRFKKQRKSKKVRSKHQ